MIVRIHLYHPEEGSHGYEYFTCASKAQKRLAQAIEHDGYCAELSYPEEAKTPISKKDVIRLLERWAHHNDNG